MTGKLRSPGPQRGRLAVLLTIWVAMLPAGTTRLAGGAPLGAGAGDPAAKPLLPPFGRQKERPFSALGDFKALGRLVLYGYLLDAANPYSRSYQSDFVGLPASGVADTFAPLPNRSLLSPSQAQYLFSNPAVLSGLAVVTFERCPRKDEPCIYSTVAHAIEPFKLFGLLKRRSMIMPLVATGAKVHAEILSGFTDCEYSCEVRQSGLFEYRGILATCKATRPAACRPPR